MRRRLRSGRALLAMQVAQYGFAAAGAVALSYCLAVSLYAKCYQAAEAKNFARDLSIMAAGSGAPPGYRALPPEDGGIVGRLEIPRLGVSVMVVEGAGAADLRRAAGHIPGTAFPGQAGNVGIAGHRDTCFRPLRSVRPDDAITLTTLAGVYRYRVTSTKVVRPEDVQVLRPAGRDSLTLVTCFPFYFVGPAPERFVVRAERLPGA